jgi:undecaprenyl-diphosphatase
MSTLSTVEHPVAASDEPDPSGRTRPRRAAGRAPRPSRGYPLLAALAGLMLAAIFVKLASEVMELELLGVDRAVRDWVMARRSPAGMRLFELVTWLGARAVLVPIVVLVAGVLLRRGARWRPLLLGLAPLATAILVQLIKQSYRVTRPPAGLGAALGYSFPSGHTSGATTVLLFLAFVLVRERVLPRYALGIAAVLALLVGASRVYLDMHWASDVLGGWTIGTACALTCCAAYEWTRRRGAPPSPPA